MPTRGEILNILAASQTQVLAFFQGLSPQDLKRPATASEVPGAAPWCPRDHLAHLVQSERNIQRLLRRALAGDTRDVLLRLQYPDEMPLPGTLGDWDALTSEEQEQLELAVGRLNEAHRNAHLDDSLDRLVADYQSARQDTLALLQQFTDEQLAAPVPTVIRELSAAELFSGLAGHATGHITWIEQGWRQDV